ncbi:oligosaccharide flippase family protein [Candidatus Reidiella endopervernicosa]|uniref:Oligosaccharide flippase family protein n=1 Tax=Candidatus Reidiella endopervernicosa TaxID=2738883 RepID=A0A6N0HVL8_9GAMM|nr:oligosaccharide flippase family protein [Candidatus Reidiella endopervernicosa]QKQ26221.1 oligosaccharide flippase family protein [Candidatus Reidiella endopervernicosa]
MRYKSSVGRNIGANYIGTIYNAIVGIAVLPLYIGYVGEEAFGLIGLYIMLQAWLTLLDLGLSPLLAREAAKSRRDESGSARLVKITHSLELMILVISLFTFLMIGYLSEWISLVWLSIGSLEAPKVIAAVTLIGLTIALRYFSSLYRSGLQGLERQVDLNVINVIIVTLRYFGALMLLRYVSVDITVFSPIRCLLA